MYDIKKKNSSLNVLMFNTIRNVNTQVNGPHVKH